MVILKASYIWDEKLNVSLLNMIKIDCDDAYIHPSIHPFSANYSWSQYIHPFPAPFTMGISRLDQSPVPLREDGSRTQAMYWN